MKGRTEKKRNWYALCAVLILMAAACVYLWKQEHQPPSGVEKTLQIEVVHADGSSREFSVTTRQDFLGPALEEEGLIVGEEGPYGIFITEVDGERIDEELQQWWCLTRDGGLPVTTGADGVAVQDGDVFELTLKTGY